MVKSIEISWKSRLEDLYEIAEASGSSAESCEEEYFVSLSARYDRRLYAIELEPIPSKEYAEFLRFADSEEDKW